MAVLVALVPVHAVERGQGGEARPDRGGVPAILAFMVFSSLVASVIEFSPTVPSAVDAAYVPSTTHAVSFAHSDHDRRSVDPRGRPIRAAASRKSAKTRFQYPRGAIASGACALRGPHPRSRPVVTGAARLTS